jgi:hypothetical protein
VTSRPSWVNALDAGEGKRYQGAAVGASTRTPRLSVGELASYKKNQMLCKSRYMGASYFIYILKTADIHDHLPWCQLNGQS